MPMPSCMANLLNFCCANPLTAVVEFQKHFVDETNETVQRQKEYADRRARELKQRAIQQHLDHLEEKFLCSVCGRSGESREEEEYIYTTYSLVHLPPQIDVAKAVRRMEFAEAERLHGGRDRWGRVRAPKGEALVGELNSRESSSYMVHKDEHKGERQTTDVFGSGGYPDSKSNTPDASKFASERQRAGEGSAHDSHGVVEDPRSDEEERYEDSDVDGDVTGLSVMDPNLVSALEIKETMRKVRNVMLRKEAKVRRKAVAVHNDKGLMMIEDNEVETFSNFFRRPLHGYLCIECHTCAKRRMDALRSTIRAILFRGEHALLRKVATKDMTLLASEGIGCTALVDAILSVQERWRMQQIQQRALLQSSKKGGGGVKAVNDDSLRLKEETASAVERNTFFADIESMHGNNINGSIITPSARQTNIENALYAASSAGGAAPSVATSRQSSTNVYQYATTSRLIDGEMITFGVLSDKAILSLRETVKCNACNRRQCCYFVTRNVLFLCAFCTAHDRYYRDNAICINDEYMPETTVRFLEDLSNCFSSIFKQNELRQMKQTEIKEADLSHFGHGSHESLFVRQPRALDLFSADNGAAPPLESKTASAAVIGATAAAPGQGEDGEVPLKVHVAPEMEARPAFEATFKAEDPKFMSGRTMVSLFDQVRVVPKVDLFQEEQAHENDVLAAGPTGQPAQQPPSSSRMDDLFQSGAPATTTPMTTTTTAFVPSPQPVVSPSAMAAFEPSPLPTHTAAPTSWDQYGHEAAVPSAYTPAAPAPAPKPKKEDAFKSLENEFMRQAPPPTAAAPHPTAAPAVVHANPVAPPHVPATTTPRTHTPPPSPPLLPSVEPVEDAAPASHEEAEADELNASGQHSYTEDGSASRPNASITDTHPPSAVHLTTHAQEHDHNTSGSDMPYYNPSDLGDKAWL